MNIQKNIEAAKVIELLGGTVAVSRMCEIQSPSVSRWKRNGIPKDQARYLREVRPDVFQSVDYEKCLSVRN